MRSRVCLTLENSSEKQLCKRFCISKRELSQHQEHSKSHFPFALFWTDHCVLVVNASFLPLGSIKNTLFFIRKNYFRHKNYFAFQLVRWLDWLTTPIAGNTEANITTIRSPKATVNNQKDWRTDFIEEGAWDRKDIIVIKVPLLTTINWISADALSNRVSELYSLNGSVKLYFGHIKNYVYIKSLNIEKHQR